MVNIKELNLAVIIHPDKIMRTRNLLSEKPDWQNITGNLAGKSLKGFCFSIEFTSRAYAYADNEVWLTNDIYAEEVVWINGPNSSL